MRGKNGETRNKKFIIWPLIRDADGLSFPLPKNALILEIDTVQLVQTPQLYRTRS